DVVIWNAATGAKLHVLKRHTADIGFVAFSPDSNHVVSAAEDGRAIVWDTRTGERERTFTYPGEDMLAATYSPDGRRLVIATTGVTRVVDVATGHVVQVLPGGFCGTPVFSPDGSRVAQGNGPLEEWDVKTGQMVFSKDVPDSSCGVVYSPDGSRLLS